MHTPIAIVATIFVLLLSGCGGGETPEDRVRSYIDQVVATAEARQWRSFGDYVTADYRDERGLDKQAVVAIATGYILANQHIYILKRIASIRIADQNHAQAVVYAALAGQPVTAAQDLVNMSANIYRFEVDLRLGDDRRYRASRSQWQPVGPEQFIVGD